MRLLGAFVGGFVGVLAGLIALVALFEVFFHMG